MAITLRNFLLKYLLLIRLSRNVSLFFKQKQQNYNDKVQHDITGYIEQWQSLSKDILQQLYINNSLYTEISYLINILNISLTGFMRTCIEKYEGVYGKCLKYLLLMMNLLFRKG